MTSAELLQLLRSSQITRGADLLARLQVSRPTLSRATMMRLLNSLGDEIVMGGAARSSAYAVRRAIRGKTQSMPLYQIDRLGKGAQIATLEPIYPQGCLFKTGATFEWPMRPDKQGGWYQGLPYPLIDMRPQGFLGQHVARTNAPLLELPEDPTHWNEDEVLWVLSILGSDTPGNLILGETAYRRHMQRLQNGYQPIAEQSVPAVYTDRADLAVKQGAPDTAIGGAFPKFTACRIKYGSPTHVLVKFSGKDQTAEMQRWSTLLICEHLALETISALLPCAAAQSLVLQDGQRTFLEVQRFDRYGEFGRSALCSWAAIEATFSDGQTGSSWLAGAERLFKEKLISETTRQHIIILWYFGKLIGNSTMHADNLSFRPSAKPGMLELAPAYDMLPTMYAPVTGAALPFQSLIPALPMPPDTSYWITAAQVAQQFWEAAAADQRITAEFRSTCNDNAILLVQAVQRVK